MPRIFSSDAYKLTVDIFLACGASADEAQMIADHLVEANLRGVDSHGLIRIPQYIRDVREGTVRPGAKIAIVHETAVSAVVDCGWNFGLVGAERAAEIALQKAQEHKMSVVVTRQCNHAGRLGYYLEKITRADFWGLGFCSSPRHGHFVVPWGGRDGRLSTNPFAYGVSMPDRPPIIADFSTSQAPEGKIRLYKNRKQKLPEGWILDASGQPSISAADFYGPPQGGILPFGGELGYRGYALGLLVEVMGTILAGYGPMEDRPGNGLALILLHPTLLASPDLYRTNLITLANYIKSSRPTKRGRDVLLPGEPEQQMRAKRLHEGIEIDDTTWSSILDVAASLNVSIELGAGLKSP